MRGTLQERRLLLRSDLEEALRNYYHSCAKVGYDFIDDLADVVYDATGGKRIAIHEIEQEAENEKKSDVQ